MRTVTSPIVSSIPKISPYGEPARPPVVPERKMPGASGSSCRGREFLIPSPAKDYFHAPPLDRHCSRFVFRLGRGGLRVAFPAANAETTQEKEEEGENAVRTSRNAVANREHAPTAHVRRKEVRR